MLRSKTFFRRGAASRLRPAKLWSSKRSRHAAAAAALLLVLAYLFFRDYGFCKRLQFFGRNHQLQKEIAAESAKRDSLLDLREKSLDDTAFIERVAREKLGMARKDETVYRFIDTTKQAGKAAP